MKTSSFRGMLMDASNDKSQGWLWVAVIISNLFSDCFPLFGYCRNLLGENFSGILNSDRYAAYNWVGLSSANCAGHLKREFIKISERPGVSSESEMLW